MSGQSSGRQKTRFGREEARFGRQRAPSPSMNSWLFCKCLKKRSRTEISVLGHEKTVFCEKTEILLSSEGPGNDIFNDNSGSRTAAIPASIWQYGMMIHTRLYEAVK